jgi:hypothetical protein
MAGGKNIEIKFTAVGAEQTADATQKVASAADDVAKSGAAVDTSNVRIVDSTKRNTESLEENKRALAEWQAQRRAAAREAGTAAIALDPEAIVDGTNALGEQRIVVEAAQTPFAEFAGIVGDEDTQSPRGGPSLNKGFTKASKGARGLAAVMRGPLSRAASVLSAGPIGLLSAAVGLVAAQFLKWKRSLDEFEESMRESARAADESARAFISEREELEANSAATVQAIQRKREFAQSQNDVFAAVQNSNTVIERNIGLLTEQQQAENEIARAREAADLAEVDDAMEREELRMRQAAEARERELRQIREQRDALQELLDVREAEAMQMEDLRPPSEAETQRRVDALRAQALDARQRGEGLLASADDAPTRVQAERQREVARGLIADAAAIEADAAATLAESAQARQRFQQESQAINAELQRIFQEIRQLDVRGETRGAVFAEEERRDSATLDRTRREAQQRREEEARREREQAEIARERELSQAQRQAGALGRRAEGMVPANARRDFRERVAGIAAGLQDGDQGGELAELLEEMQKLAAGIRGQSQAQREEFRILKEDLRRTNTIISNNRPR